MIYVPDFQVGPISFETIVNEYRRLWKNKKTKNMKLIEPTNFHIVDQPIDAIDVIRKKTICGDVDDEAFYVCNVSDIVEKYRNWQKHMPRIIPFYGKCGMNEVFIMNSYWNCAMLCIYKIVNVKFLFSVFILVWVCEIQ